MKKSLFTLTLVTLVLALQAQSGISQKQAPATQAVLTALITNPNVVVISGKLIDASNSKPITNAKINFEKVGTGVVNAAVDKDGNYAIAINKDVIGNHTSLSFKIDGYNDLKVKHVNVKRELQQMDVRLLPVEKYETPNVKYVLSDDPYNTLVIKF
jgi:hypothetical protein